LFLANQKELAMQIKTEVDLSSMNMSQVRVYVRELVDDMASRFGGRALVIDVLREDWTEAAKRAGFASELHDDNRTVYLPMLLTALDELEA
jgi:hypothetical protein